LTQGVLPWKSQVRDYCSTHEVGFCDFPTSCPIGDRCKSCPQVKFSPSASSTFVDLNRSGTIGFETGGGVDPVIDNDYVLTLDAGMDTVGLVGGFSAPSIQVFLITNQTSKFNIDPFSGIQGESRISSCS